MPWREKPSEYWTVVSEFMLQQTQVATVVPYFERFVRRFPDFSVLARASDDEVVAVWSGLGYYRRARLLREAAAQIVRRHGGCLPADPETLRGLPGFGEYTAAAVGSIALGLPMACVDGNVRRVLARLSGWRDPNPDELRKSAVRLLDRAAPGDWNQAMMELGATICTPRRPRCPECPVRDHCAALRAGNPEEYPAPKQAAETRPVAEVAVAAVSAGRVLVVRRAAGGAFGGMWELPRLDSREVRPADLTPARVLKTLTGLASRKFHDAGESRSVFTNHRITTRLFTAAPTGSRVRLTPAHIESHWATPAELARLGASGAQRRLFEITVAGMRTSSPSRPRPAKKPVRKPTSSPGSRGR